MFILDSIITGCSSPGISRLLLILQNILSLVQLIGPILLIIYATVTFTKLVANPDEKKHLKSLKNQLLAILFLFAVPIIINATMGMVDDTFSITQCWNSLANTKTNDVTFINTTNREKTTVLTDPNDYEIGNSKMNKSGNSSSTETIEGSAQTYKDVVWDSSDLTKISNLTSAQLIKILNAYGGNAKNLIPYAANYITAENKYKVNAFFLIGLNALESGWATSSIAQSCNNLGGVCASSNHPSNGCGSNSNCSFAKFNSIGDFIDYNASMLNSNYLTPGGDYYEGKGLTSVYTKHYCPGCTSAAGEINTIATGLFNKTKEVM